MRFADSLNQDRVSTCGVPSCGPRFSAFLFPEKKNRTRKKDKGLRATTQHSLTYKCMLASEERVAYQSMESSIQLTATMLVPVYGTPASRANTRVSSRWHCGPVDSARFEKEDAVTSWGRRGEIGRAGRQIHTPTKAVKKSKAWPVENERVHPILLCHGRLRRVLQGKC